MWEKKSSYRMNYFTEFICCLLIFLFLLISLLLLSGAILVGILGLDCTNHIKVHIFSSYF